MLPIDCLERAVTWPELTKALGLPDSGLRGPQECPLCHGRMVIYDDNRKGGLWHHCYTCGSCGDGLALAASYWGLPLVLVPEKLAAAGVPLGEGLLSMDTIEKYVDERSDEHLVEALWKRCQSYLIQNQRAATLNTLRVRFRLQAPISEERWRQGPGQCLGAMRKGEVEALFKAFRRPGKEGRLSVFHGPGWGDVLVVPYYDLPGRICGVFCVGRKGDREDKVFRGHLLAGQRGRHEEAGLAGLPFVLGRQDDIVAVEDPLLFARLHVKHFSTTTVPLSLIAWQDGSGAKTVSAWQCLQGRHVIFWDWAPSHKTWAQVIRADGYLCTLGPHDEGVANIDHYLRLKAPADLLKKVLRHATPWRNALSNRVVREGLDWSEAMLLQVSKEVNIDEVVSQLSAGAQEVLQSAMLRRPVSREAQVGELEVAEHHGMWFQRLARGERLISNFTLRVSGMQTVKGVVAYRGELITRDGVRVPFAMTSKGTRKYLDTLGQDRVNMAKGGPLFLRDGWGSKLLTIALTMCPLPDSMIGEKLSPEEVAQLE